MGRIDELREQFAKKRVLELSEIMLFLGTKSRMTAYRHLKQLNYLSSYSHNGKFYTLRELVKFDETGLYTLSDISFSEQGTLSDTLVHVVENSEAGKTSFELEQQYHVSVKNALLNLVNTKRIEREKLEGNVFVYLSADPSKRQQQLAKWAEKTRLSLPNWVELEVLVEIIRASNQIVHASTIAFRLCKRGYRIRKDQVQQVLEKYDLEKKTPDFMP